MNPADDVDPYIRPPLGQPNLALREPGGRAAGDELSFWDLLDVINPLQHLPIVGTLYREITGDSLSGPARILGGTLFGGPIGMIAGIADSLVEEIGGKDVGGTVMAALFGDEAPDAAPADPQLAESQAPAAASAAPPSPAIETASEPPPVDGAGTVLTGADALRALAADLRGGGVQGPSDTADSPDRPPGDRGGESVSAAPPAEAFMALRPRDFAGVPVQQARPLAPQRSTPTPPPGPPPARSAPVERPADAMVATDSPPSRFTQQMMEALLKYQALEAEKGRPSDAAAGPAS